MYNYAVWAELLNNYQQETDTTQKIIEDLIARTNEMLHPNPGEFYFIIGLPELI